MKRVAAWILCGVMTLGVSALAAGQVQEERSASMELVVKPYAEVTMTSNEFRLELDNPRADGGSFESDPITFRVVTNDKVSISITEDFSDGLMSHFGLNEAQLKDLLNPRLWLAFHTERTTERGKDFSLPGVIPTRELNAERGGYEMKVLLNWNKYSEWWRIIPTEKTMGQVYITVASL